jgi:hypothetical protein
VTVGFGVEIELNHIVSPPLLFIVSLSSVSTLHSRHFEIVEIFNESSCYVVMLMACVGFLCRANKSSLY